LRLSKQQQASPPTLVVGSDHRIAIAIARCLNRHGIPVDIAFPRDVPCRSVHIRQRHSIGSLEDPSAVAETVLRLIDQDGYDTIFATNDLALAGLAQHRHLLSASAHIACPPAEVVASVLSKERTLAAAKAIGLGLPATQMGTTVDRADDLRLSFPIVAKPANKALRSSVKVLHIEDEKAFRGFLTDWQGAHHHFLFQEYVPGIGVGVELLIDSGQALAVFQHQREEDLPATGGVSVLARAVHPDEQLVQRSRALLEELGWQGVAMVEYRYDPETREATLIEVNGRFWGSLALADFAGLEFPWYQWQLLHGIDPKVPETYPVGRRIAWTAGRIERLVGYLANRPPEWILASSPSREIASFLRFLPPFTRDAVWRLNDPLAPVGELEQVGRKLLKSLPPGVTRFKKLTGKAKLAYLQMRLGLGRSSVPKIDRAHSILIVCHGNIIRSAFAEALMKKKLGPRGIEIASCGTHASEPAADAMAIACADSMGIDLTSHRPQRITEELLDRADLVLAMDWFNLAHLVSDYPAVAPAKTVLFSAYGSRAETIQDPYGRDWKSFRRCFRRIEEHADAIREQVSQGGGAA
jgi:protein-tyrosine-phosphatase/predicted ATP-grasp superfamily ATP-dependent carboligase